MTTVGPNHLTKRTRTMLCATAWRVGSSADETGFDELRELCTTSGNRVSLAAGLSGAMLSIDHGHSPSRCRAAGL